MKHDQSTGDGPPPLNFDAWSDPDTLADRLVSLMRRLRFPPEERSVDGARRFLVRRLDELSSTVEQWSMARLVTELERCKRTTAGLAPIYLALFRATKQWPADPDPEALEYAMALDRAEAEQGPASATWRPVDATGETPQAVVDAVRRVFPDWDGHNWATVREALRQDGRAEHVIDAMGLQDVRQYFAVGWKRIAKMLGGVAYTNTATIIGPVEAPAKVPAAARSAPKPPVGVVARALGVLADFPGIESVRSVAKKAECDYSTLYKSPKFMEAWQRVRQLQGTAPVRGFKDSAGTLEASRERLPARRR